MATYFERMGGAQPPEEPQGTFGNAVDRGTDQLQGSLYAVSNAIGRLTGVDAIEKWGEEGVERNMAQLAANPPEIHSWDDVEDLATFGTYFLEALGEQAPQFAIDAAIGIAGGVTGAGIGAIAARRAAMTTVQKAAIGKGLKRSMGEAAYGSFRTRLKNASAGEIGVGVGVTLSNFGQNAGETQMGFMADDIDAPGTALLAGAAKGVLDTIAPLQALAIAKRAGVGAATLPKLMGRIAADTGITLGTESATEGMQTVVDHIATRIHDPEFDMFGEDARFEIREAMIKGGLVGGTLGGAVSAVREGANYRHDPDGFGQLLDTEIAEVESSIDSRRQTDDLVRQRLDPNFATPLQPESQETIDAQAAALLDPTSSKDTIEVTGGSPQPSFEEFYSNEDIQQIPTENGIAYTTDAGKADAILGAGGTEQVMGEALYNNTGGKDNSDGTVVVARNEFGVPIYEYATNQQDVPTAVAEAEAQKPEGGSVEATDVETVLQERQRATAPEVTENRQAAAVVGTGQADRAAPMKEQAQARVAATRDKRARADREETLGKPLLKQKVADGETPFYTQEEDGSYYANGKEQGSFDTRVALEMTAEERAEAAEAEAGIATAIETGTGLSAAYGKRNAVLAPAVVRTLSTEPVTGVGPGAQVTRSRNKAEQATQRAGIVQETQAREQADGPIKPDSSLAKARVAKARIAKRQAADDEKAAATAERLAAARAKAKANRGRLSLKKDKVNEAPRRTKADTSRILAAVLRDRFPDQEERETVISAVNGGRLSDPAMERARVNQLNSLDREVERRFQEEMAGGKGEATILAPVDADQKDADPVEDAEPMTAMAQAFAEAKARQEDNAPPADVAEDTTDDDPDRAIAEDGTRGGLTEGQDIAPKIRANVNNYTVTPELTYKKHQSAEAEAKASQLNKRNDGPLGFQVIRLPSGEFAVVKPEGFASVEAAVAHIRENLSDQFIITDNRAESGGNPTKLGVTLIPTSDTVGDARLVERPRFSEAELRRRIARAISNRTGSGTSKLLVEQAPTALNLKKHRARFFIEEEIIPANISGDVLIDLPKDIRSFLDKGADETTIRSAVRSMIEGAGARVGGRRKLGTQLQRDGSGEKISELSDWNTQFITFRGTDDSTTIVTMLAPDVMSLGKAVNQAEGVTTEQTTVEMELAAFHTGLAVFAEYGDIFHQGDIKGDTMIGPGRRWVQNTGQGTTLTYDKAVAGAEKAYRRRNPGKADGLKRTADGSVTKAVRRNEDGTREEFFTDYQGGPRISGMSDWDFRERDQIQGLDGVEHIKSGDIIGYDHKKGLVLRTDAEETVYNASGTQRKSRIDVSLREKDKGRRTVANEPTARSDTDADGVSRGTPQERRQAALDKRAAAYEESLGDTPQDISVVAKVLASKEEETIEAARKAENSSAGLTDPKSKKPLARTISYGNKLGKNAANFVQGILNELGITDLGMVIGDSTPESVDALFRAGHITKQEAVEINRRFQDPDQKGVFIPKGKSGIIVVRSAGSRADVMAVLGHEVGHAVWNTIYQGVLNPTTERQTILRDKLFAAFGADSATDGIYSAEGGFKEWFADKISARAQGIVQDADNGVVERFFRSSAAQLRKVFNAVKGRLHPRFSRNLVFERIIDLYKAENVFSRATSFGWGKMEDMTQAEQEYMDAGEKLREAVNDSLNAKKSIDETVGRVKFTKAAAFFKQLVDNPIEALAGNSLAGILFDMDNNLRGMGLGPLADIFYKPTNTKGNTNAIMNRIAAENKRWVGKLQTALPRTTSPAMLRQVYDQLNRGVADKDLSPQALKLRKIIKQYHGYLKEAMPTLGELENYFPRLYDINEIIGRSDEFVRILTEAGFKDAVGVFETLVNNQGINSPDGFMALRSRISYDRRIDQATANKLVEAGFLNPDPVAALANYFGSTIKRAERERRFGGYKYLKGVELNATIERKYKTKTEKDAAYARTQTILQGYLDEYGLSSRAKALEQGFAREDDNGNIEWYDPELKLKQLFQDAVESQTAGQTGKQRQAFAARLDKILKLYMERPDKALDPQSFRYNLIGEIRAFQSLGTLIFSGVASIPEIAVAFVRAKGELGLVDFGRIIMNNATNFNELRESAEMMGTIERNIADAMMTEMYTPYASEQGRGRFFRRALPYMFKLNMNEGLVTYTRMVSKQVGTQFIKQSIEKAAKGSARHQRYLDELGVELESGKRWLRDATFRGMKESMVLDTGSQHSKDSAHIRLGINRFVDESVLRPNAAERPTWANHPIGTFIFHLKTFAYSFGKNVAGGVAREVIARHKESPGMIDSILTNAMFLLPGAMLFMAFGAFSDELRNRIKTFGAGGSFAAARRDPVDMVAKWADRTGFITSTPFFDPIYDTVTGSPSLGSLAFGLGPTTSHLYDLFGDDEGPTKDKLLKSLPILRQIPWARGEFGPKKSGPERWMYKNMLKSMESDGPRKEGPPLRGTVVKVQDGDTVDVRDAEGKVTTIRFFGIDTAESKQLRGDEQGAAMRDMVLGKNVTVRMFGSGIHGRALGIVMLNGVDMNLEMLKRGLAWHSYSFSNDMPEGLRTIYSEHANRAAGENMGFWADDYRINPENWRAIVKKYEKATGAR